MSSWWPNPSSMFVFLSSFTSEGEAPFYDFKNHYVRVSPECVNEIDSLLSDPNYGFIKHKIIQSGNRVKPNTGTHNYYLNKPSLRSYFPRKFINLIKKKEISTGGSSNQSQGGNNEENYYYVVCYGSSNQDVFNNFLKRLFATNEREVKAIHIDTSGYENKSILVTRFSGTCKPRQSQAIEMIRDHFLSSQDRNTKVIISGKRGVGKTYTGGLLKKAIESSFDGYARQCFVQLFIDFNPTSPGLDVQTHVLSKASKNSPVILVINEIDISYHEVFKSDTHNDIRSAHTRNKASFNDMLDAISNAPNVITIFTTEKSKDELDSVTNSNGNHSISFKSFYRKGRVDFFINMTPDTPGSEGKSIRINTNNDI